MWDWLNMLFVPAVAGVCAVQIFGGDQLESLPRPEKFRPHDYLLAVLVPLAVALGPRILLKLVREFLFALSGVRSGGFPPAWSDLFAFRPLPWLLVVYVVAWLEEFVLRECLQNRLERILGLKRAILFVPLLWWMLSVYNHFGPIPSLRIAVPGISALVSLFVYIAYSIPLGWLYARTRSLSAVTLMHGTMLLFRAGNPALGVYFNYRSLYWIETACWVFVGWFLFKEYPVGRQVASVTPSPA